MRFTISGCEWTAQQHLRMRCSDAVTGAYTQCECPGLQKCDVDFWHTVMAALCTHTAQPADLRAETLRQVFQVQ